MFPKYRCKCKWILTATVLNCSSVSTYYRFIHARNNVAIKLTKASAIMMCFLNPLFLLFYNPDWVRS